MAAASLFSKFRNFTHAIRKNSHKNKTLFLTFIDGGQTNVVLNWDSHADSNSTKNSTRIKRVKKTN
jgi:hypothetical protein